MGRFRSRLLKLGLVDEPRDPLQERPKPARQGGKWVSTDEWELSSLWLAGDTLSTIALTLRRTEGAIVAKVVNLRLTRDRDTARSLSRATGEVRGAEQVAVQEMTREPARNDLRSAASPGVDRRSHVG